MPAASRQSGPVDAGRRRLDVMLVERGLVASREKAQALIVAGLVTVAGRAARKAAEPVGPEAELAVATMVGFVSRGGEKLDHGLTHFGIDVTDRVCLDAGASTGGFTDVLLRRGARRVYAVDVGHGQLDWRLRNDGRVVVHERTNIRDLAALPEPVDVAVVDVSFISLRLVLPTVARLCRPNAPLVCLVKPQFEAGREQVGRGGVVRDPAIHRGVLIGLWAWAVERGLTPRGVTASPIRGPAGNVEFLLWLENLASVFEPNSVGSAEPGGVLSAEEAVAAAIAEAPTRLAAGPR